MSRLTWSRRADKHSPGRPRNKTVLRFSQWVRSSCRGNADVWPALFPVWVCVCVWMCVCLLLSEGVSDSFPKCPIGQSIQVSWSLTSSPLNVEVWTQRSSALETELLSHSSRHTKTFANNCEYSWHFWEQTEPLLHTSCPDRCRLPTLRHSDKRFKLRREGGKSRLLHLCLSTEQSAAGCWYWGGVGGSSSSSLQQSSSISAAAVGKLWQQQPH